MAAERPALPSTEQLFEEMPCGLLVTATDGTILRVNATFCGWVGQSREELTGRRKLQELFTRGARIFHHTHWQPMLEMQRSISKVKFDVAVQDGRPLPMIFNVVRRRTEAGTYDEISAVIAEDRNRYERELLAARQRADGLVLLEKDRTLFAEQMIGIVSHDLRNPLSVVTLATRALARGDAFKDERSRRMLAGIGQAGERAQRLIEDLLDFTAARMGSGLAATLKRVDLHRIAERAVEELSIAYPGRALRHVQGGDGVVDADSDRLTQLLGNLVSNAMTYGDATGTVTVTSEVAGGVARLAVHNTGPVIEPPVIATMFEPMVRGGTPEHSDRSVGLGLFIVRAIAAAHRGEVTVTSSVEQGTLLSLTFPALSMP